jgi:TatD DNase family protein
MLIDSHAHLTDPGFSDEMPQLLERAKQAGVEAVVTIGITPESSRHGIELARKHPNVFATPGLHPTSVTRIDAGSDVWLEDLRQLTTAPKVVAYGEIGLDNFHPPRGGLSGEDYHKLQVHCFEAQLELAAAAGLNVVIHQRGDCFEEVCAILKPWTGKLRAVFHCFSHGWNKAAPLIDDGHLISFTGIATFRSASELHETCRRAPAGSFMVETDAPYLAPVPHRGKRCEPAHVRLTAEHIAQLRGETLAALAQHTGAAACGLDDDELLGDEIHAILERSNAHHIGQQVVGSQPCAADSPIQVVDRNVMTGVGESSVDSSDFSLDLAAKVAVLLDVITAGDGDLDEGHLTAQIWTAVQQVLN